MSSEKVQYKDIGGQAVMEGVMMQSPSDDPSPLPFADPTAKSWSHAAIANRFPKSISGWGFR